MEPMHTNTPKHFVVQLGALLALYAALTSLLILLFNITNIKFPDEAAPYYELESAREAIRASLAFLVVCFPAYLWLTRSANQSRRQESGGQYTTLTRWLIYLSLLVAGGVLLGDLVTLIRYFLSGEITTRFIIKVIGLLVVVGSAFYYYTLDIRGYFTHRVKTALYAAAGASAVVVLALICGYQFIETPAQVRELRLDEQQVTDLQSLQSTVENYYQLHDVLPSDLATAYGALDVPTAPTGRADYTYVLQDATHYQLCATFTAASSDLKNGTPVSVTTGLNYTWTHEAGRWCFDRVVGTDAKLIR